MALGRGESAFDGGRWATTITAVAITTSVTLYGRWMIMKKKDQGGRKSVREHDIPRVAGGLPLLGHAMSYKSDPPRFLTEQERILDSPVFEMNMAGRRMIVLGSDPGLVRQVSRQPETVVSSRQARGRIGWEYMFGPVGSRTGSSFRKRFLRTRLRSDDDFDGGFLPRAFDALNRALEVEARRTATTIQSEFAGGKNGEESVVAQLDDLFLLARRCTLRAMMECFLGRPVVDRGGARLIDSLLDYMTTIDTTLAFSFMFPKFLALPLFLWPCAAKRRRLTRSLALCLEEGANAASSENGCDVGPMLRMIQEDGTPFDDAAELVIGFLFGAQRNSSVAASQSFCFLQEFDNGGGLSGGGAALLDAREEAVALFEASGLAFSSSSPATIAVKMNSDMLVRAGTLRRCVIETMRLSAHPIGGIRYAHRSFPLEASDGSGRRYTILEGDTIAISHIAPHLNRSLWGDDADRFRLDRPEYDDQNRDKGWKDRGAAEADGVYGSCGGPATAEMSAKTSCPASHDVRPLASKRGRNTPTMALPVDEYKLTTFSHGIHKCPGEAFALSLAEMVLALLLAHDATLEGDGGGDGRKKLPPLKYVGSTLTQRDGPVPASIRLGRV